MGIVRAKWTTVPNKNIRQLNVDVELWDSIEVSCHEIALSDDQRLLVDLLGSIHGVIDCGFEKYRIRVTKGEVFGWDEILPRVESVVSEWRGDKLVLVGASRA